MSDLIVEEVRRIREEHAAEFLFDVDAIYADLKRLEAERNLPRVSFGPRRIGNLTPSIEAAPSQITAR